MQMSSQSTAYVADFFQMDKQRAEELIIQTRDWSGRRSAVN